MKKNDRQIEQISIQALIPYARNSRTHSDASAVEPDSRPEPVGQNRRAVVEGKLRCFFGEFFRINKASVRHVMMVRAEGDEVGKVICPAVFFGNYMMDGGNGGEAADHAFIPVTNAGRIFPRSVHGFRYAGNCPPVGFLGAFWRAKAQPPTLKQRRRYGNQRSANFAGVFSPVVEGVVSARSVAPELVAALFRAVFPRLNVRHGLKRFLTMLAFMDVRRLPLAAPVVPGYEHFPRSYLRSAAAFTIC